MREHKEGKWRNFCTCLNDHRVSDTILWRKIKSIEATTQEKPPKTPTLIHNGSVSADPRKVAQIFAEQQEAIFTEPDDPAFDASFKEEVDAHHYSATNVMEGGHRRHAAEAAQSRAKTEKIASF